MEIKRDIYVQKLINRMHNGMVKIITGIRRCGKSYLLLKLFRKHLLNSGVPDDHIIVMEFDRIDNEQYLEPHTFMAYLRKHMTDSGNYYILLDEVQLLPKFEAVLNSLLYEENVDCNC